MKPMFSVYKDFYCRDSNCDLMDCDHDFVPAGDGLTIEFNIPDEICMICWVRYRRAYHQYSWKDATDHEPTGPWEWRWH